MLEQMRGGRKVLWQMKKADPELENVKNIRFITSSYEDRFKIPDGSAVAVSYTHLDVYKRQHQWRIPCGHLCRQRDDDPLWLTNFLCFH